MSLFRNIMYSNAPILKQYNSFYGQYDYLNAAGCPSDSDIYNYQYFKLREFQTQSIKNNSKAEALNNFLMLNGKFTHSAKEYDQILLEHLQDLYDQINSLIATGAMGTNVREQLLSNKQLEQSILDRLNQIGKSLDTLRKTSSMTISSTYISYLDNLVKSLPGNNLDLVLRTLYHLKGDILEEIGTEWLNKNMPMNIRIGSRAYSTGALRGKSGQIIQDILIMDMDKINLDQSIIIDFSLDKKSYSLPIKDFLRMVEKYQGNKQIILTSEAEALLNKYSIAGIQAKAGVNQLPWNTSSKNTWTSIINAKGSEADLYIDFLDGVQELYQSWDIDHKNIKTQSTEYTAMANYALSTQLSRVLHLSQMGNQYVLTPQGFMPFIDRILQLYEKRGGDRYLFSFGGRIQMEKTDNILLKSRPVILGV